MLIPSAGMNIAQLFEASVQVIRATKSGSCELADIPS